MSTETDESAEPRRLSLLRHAKAARDAPSDFERPLAPRGQRDAPATGRRIADWADPPTLIVTSDARRAQQTAEAVRDAFATAPPIVLAPDLYLAAPSQLLASVEALAPEHRHVLVVGHNPGLSDFATQLADTNLGDLPTCAVVRMRLWVPEWSDVGWGCAGVECVDTPKSPAS